MNRLCGSGFQSVISGTQEILVGDSSIVLTGGTDNMSACPYAVRDIRFGTRLGSDPKLEDMMWTSLTDQLAKVMLMLVPIIIITIKKFVCEILLRSPGFQSRSRGIWLDP